MAPIRRLRRSSAIMVGSVRSASCEAWHFLRSFPGKRECRAACSMLLLWRWVPAFAGTSGRRICRRHEARDDVVGDCLGRTLAWVTVATAPGGKEGDAVAGRDLDLGRLLDCGLVAVGTQDHALVDRAGLAAVQAQRRVEREVVDVVGVV